MASRLSRPPKTLQRILLKWLILIAVLPLIFVAFGILWYTEQTLIEDKQHYLYGLARDKGDWIQEKISHLQNMSESITKVNIIKETLCDPSMENIALADRFAQTLLNQYQHHDFILANKAGTVIYSAKHDAENQINLTAPIWKDTLIGKAFEQTKLLQGSTITPYEWYDPSLKKAAFVSSPAFNDHGYWIGVVIVQVNNQWLNQIANSRVSLSDTGEIVLPYLNEFGDIEALAPLRLNQNIPHRHDDLQEHWGKEHHLVLATPATPKKSLPAVLAIAGTEGWGEQIDYRNEAVIAGWVHIPALNMGLVVKQDLDEIRQPIIWQRMLTALLLLVVIVLILGAIMNITRRFVQPIRHISHLVSELAQGKWHRRVQKVDAQQSSEEVHMLTIGVNQMADTIERQMEHLTHQSAKLEAQAKELELYAHDLEDLVAERTAELAALSVIDPLTNLFNRRHYLNEAPKVWRQAARNEQVMAFFMLDIDYFKQYNDTLGHQQGDTALQAVAGVLKDFCRRSGELAFRMGGEEMAIVMPLKNDDTVQSIADNIRTEILQLALPHPASPVHFLTVSIGVGLFDGRGCHTVIEPNFDALYAIADQALYDAKHSGRNKAIVAERRLTCADVAVGV